MKFRFLFFVLVSLVFLSASVDVPQSFNYQAAIRNSDGEPFANEIVGLEVNILQGSATGPVVYQEAHTVSTNNLGLVNLAIGNGTPALNAFSDINWSTGNYWLAIGIDTTGGTNYQPFQASRFLSVPFAMAANTASVADTAKYVASTAGVGIPSGVIVMWSGVLANIPQGWALCDGSSSTPDLRDRFIVSIGNKYAVGDMGGEDFHVLTIDEMPAHTHGNTFNASGPHNVGSNGNGQFGNTGSTGGNQPHENRPPYYALAFIMKQ